MKDKILTEHDILELSSRQESHFYDRKAKAIDGKKIQKICTAFANADGGDFIVGIKDNKDEPEPSKRWDGEAIGYSAQSVPVIPRQSVPPDSAVIDHHFPV